MPLRCGTEAKGSPSLLAFHLSAKLPDAPASKMK
jgi:hypothetical protein